MKGLFKNTQVVLVVAASGWWAGGGDNTGVSGNEGMKMLWW